MSFEIDEQTYQQIEAVIHSDASPVGIDAKKTHIIILKMLTDLNTRLAGLEEAVSRLEPR